MSADELDTQSTRFPGHEFAQARERLRLSEEQVSSELNLPIKVIKVIESGNPSSFHNPVFIRGYIRTYAKHLGMDPTFYANLYSNLPGVDLKPSTIKSTTSVQDRDPSRSPWMKLFSWMFVLVIIAIIIWWSREQSGKSPVTFFPSSSSVLSSSEKDDPEDVFDSERLDGPSANEVESENSSQLSSYTELMHSQDDDQLTHEELAQHLVPEQPAVTPIQAVSDASELIMRFSGDCWVQVRDANQALLYSGVAQGGTELQLKGDLPLSLVIGRRDAVAELTFKGELIDLAGLTTGNVARFILPLSQ